MFLWVISISCVSLLLIFIIHQLILFFKSTLTVPKVKDFIHSPHEKYKHIYDTISSSSTNSSITSGLGKYNDASIIPNIDTSNPYDSTGADTIDASMINNSGVSSSQNKDMKNELKNFLKKQLKNG